MPATQLRTDEQMGLFDLKVESKELLGALNRWQYLQTAVDEQEAIGEVIDALLYAEFPDVAAGKRRLNVGNELIIEYEIREPKRRWKLTETPFTATTQDGPQP